MNKKLWEPSRKIKLNSNLLKFEKYIYPIDLRKSSITITKKFIVGQLSIHKIFGAVFGIMQK